VRWNGDTAFLSHFDRVEFLLLLLGFELGDFGGDGLFNVLFILVVFVVFISLVVVLVLVRTLSFTPEFLIKLLLAQSVIDGTSSNNV
jgi:hypothetical protein